MADLPVQGVIFTHPHGDHYGGIAAVKEASSKKNFDIIAPKGFMASAQNENVLAGVTMIRRAAYMYGLRLQPGEKVHWVVVWDSVCQRVARASPVLLSK